MASGGNPFLRSPLRVYNRGSSQSLVETNSYTVYFRSPNLLTRLTWQFQLRWEIVSSSLIRPCVAHWACWIPTVQGSICPGHCTTSSRKSAWHTCNTSTHVKTIVTADRAHCHTSSGTLLCRTSVWCSLKSHTDSGHSRRLGRCTTHPWFWDGVGT